MRVKCLWMIEPMVICFFVLLAVDARTLAQFQRSEMFLAFIQDFVDRYLKY